MKKDHFDANPVIYLDNSATTFLLPEVCDYLTSIAKTAANPSSLHRLGIEAERVMNKSREAIALLLEVLPQEIIFTSGGTESNNLAIRGSLKSSRIGKHLITTKIEHPSVYNTLKDLERDGFQVTYLDVDKNGCIDIEEVSKALTCETSLVSIMHVNNEVGTIAPIAKIGKLLKSLPQKIVFHVDAVQSFCRLPIRPHDMNIDLLSISGHKIHGPKGVGALYVRKGHTLKPILTGGGQEGNVRSGTENVPAIAAFGLAAQILGSQMNSSLEKLKTLRERFISNVMNQIPFAKINSPSKNAAPHILNMSFRGLKGELIVRYLEQKGVFVSTGSACSSRDTIPSRVLLAMGLDAVDIEGSIRISLSPFNEEWEIDTAASALVEVAGELKKLGHGRGRRA